MNGKRSKERGRALYKKVRMGDEKQNTAGAILRALNEIDESDINDAFPTTFSSRRIEQLTVQV